MVRYEDPAFQASMKIKLDVSNMMQEVLGEKGFTAEQLQDPIFAKAAAQMTAQKKNMGFRQLPYTDPALLDEILQTAAEIREKFEAFVILGIGGSALGPIAVQQALNHLRYNELPAEKRGGPRFYVEDNIDPARMEALFDVIDVKKTCFNVITKSGSTSETMAQFLIIADKLKQAGVPLKENMIATTDKEKGNLIKIARQEGLKTFIIPDGVGGRFTELTPVGLLGAAVCGIDIKEMIAGARYMDQMLESENVMENMAYLDGALQYLCMENGINISVMIPYADTLKYMSDWYAQLWAESLGKNITRDGKPVHVGQTPVKALGVTDQHSQVQLYTEGPFDKVVTFLAVGDYGPVVDIPHGFEDVPDVAFLGGHTMNELISAEQFATAYALNRAKRLNKTFTLPEVNAFTVGQLLYVLEVETAFLGELYNINAFDQPGVEEGKNAAYALLGKNGYDAKREEMDNAPKPVAKYIL